MIHVVHMPNDHSISEPTIRCPSCQTEIRLTESLAAPMLAAKQKEFEEREARIVQQRLKLESDSKEQEKQFAVRLEAEQAKSLKLVEEARAKVAVVEKEKARQAVRDEIEVKNAQVAELLQLGKDSAAKLASAQKDQAEAVKAKREFDEKSAAMELTIEQGISQQIGPERDKAVRQAQEQFATQLSEERLKNEQLRKSLEEANRKASQGSQQSQGEALELQLEGMLREKFPFDTLAAVPTGQHGGDCLHTIKNSQQQACGTIIWEFKRTKSWSDGWLSKLRYDQGIAKADVAVIVSFALPKEVEVFDLRDGVWVVHPRASVPVAMMLRDALLKLAAARTSSQGQATKAEMVYQYITGNAFRQRISAVVEAFTIMQDDLAKERIAIEKQWSKRSKQLELMMKATTGLYGDLQGIAGGSVPEINGMELKRLEE